MTKFLKSLFLLIAFMLPLLTKGQCDVAIVPGSVQVTETEDAVMFSFDVINNSSSDWMGDDIIMYWSLNSGANIMSIQYGDGSDPGHPPPLAPGQSQTFNTPWMAIPNLPNWFPDDPTNDNPWLESMDWAYYTLPFPFNGSWSPINLRLASCGLADGAWVYDEAGELYYGPTNLSMCQDENSDGFCDCDLNVLNYDQDTHVVSIEIKSSYNCGCNYATDNNYMDCYNANGASSNNTSIEHLVFGLNVQGLNTNWLPCLTAQYHQGWTFALLSYFANPLVSGDFIEDELILLGDCWEDMLNMSPNSLCMQMSLWQINLSQTANQSVSYNGITGWAESCGTCAFDSQNYPDIDIDNNLVVWCFDENPPDPDVPGCTDPTANNYNVDATEDDGSCIYDILGCTTPGSCNYDSSATINDGSCIQCDPEFCSEFQLTIFGCYGCTDPLAANYSESAVLDNGSCEYLEIIDISLDTILYTSECDEFGPYWSPQFHLTNEGTMPITEFCIVEDILGTWAPNDTVCFDNIVIQPGETHIQYWPNMYEWGVLSVRVIDVNGYSGVTWNNFGLDDDVADNMYVQIINDEPECPSTDAALNFNQLSFECIDNEAYINSSVIVQNWGQDTIFTYCISIPELNYEECFDGYSQTVYFIEPSGGQMFNLPPISANLDSITITVYEVNDEPLELQDNNTIQINFTIDTDACLIEGCTDINADNYDPNATLDDGSCIYTILGCTDETANNFNPNATDDDGSCTYDVFGCTDLLADNYDETANIDDGTCIYMGCTDEAANNFDPTANMDDGSCTYDIFGCTDPSANNFNPNATIDDGSCTFDVLGCTDISANNYNPLATVDDGSCQYNVLGCTDTSALNYNPFANIDDGSCLYYDPCDEQDIPVYVPNVFTPNGDGINDVWQIITNSDCWLSWDVKIFNRWGVMIYEMNSPDQVWDGTVMGRDRIVPDGVYVCRIIARGRNARVFETTTDITVFK